MVCLSERVLINQPMSRWSHEERREERGGERRERGEIGEKAERGREVDILANSLTWGRGEGWPLIILFLEGAAVAMRGTKVTVPRKSCSQLVCMNN